MGQTVKDVMTPNVIACDSSTSVMDAARLMRDLGIGDVLVSDAGQLCGIVTDRDIVVRGLAGGKNLVRATLGEVCSGDITCVAPDTSIEDATQLMRDRAIRRLPVATGGKAVGVLTLGDLAMERDPRSALADISAARPNA